MVWGVRRHRYNVLHYTYPPLLHLPSHFFATSLHYIGQLYSRIKILYAYRDLYGCTVLEYMYSRPVTILFCAEEVVFWSVVSPQIERATLWKVATRPTSGDDDVGVINI